MNNKNTTEVERVTKHMPTPDQDLATLAAHIIAHPGSYISTATELAKGVSGLLERIIDLEDDVERLRPRVPFVPEVLFEYDSLNTKVLIDTHSGGGLCIDATDLVTGSNVVTMTTREQGLQLTTALNKWAGVDGELNWKTIGDPPDDDRRVLLTVVGSNLASTGYVNGGAWVWAYNEKPTHWAPLPKPPVQS